MGSFKHELLVPNLSGIPLLLQHGSEDDNVPPYHSRLMHQLLTEVSANSSYVEISGAGHWFDGVMTTKELTRFYKSTLDSNSSSHQLPLNFTWVVTNSDDFRSRGGLLIEQMDSPDRPAKIVVNRDSAIHTWRLSTSNVHRFSIDVSQRRTERPRQFILDEQEWDLSSDVGSVMFVKSDCSTWNVSKDVHLLLIPLFLTLPQARPRYRELENIGSAVWPSAGDNGRDTANKWIFPHQRWSVIS